MFGELIGLITRSKAFIPIVGVAAFGVYAYLTPQIFEPLPPTVSVTVMDPQSPCVDVRGHKTDQHKANSNTGLICMGMVRLKSISRENNFASAFFDPNTLAVEWNVTLNSQIPNRVTTYLVKSRRLFDPSSEAIDIVADPSLKTLVQTVYQYPQKRDPNVIEPYPKPTPSPLQPQP